LEAKIELEREVSLLTTFFYKKNVRKEDFLFCANIFANRRVTRIRDGYLGHASHRKIQQVKKNAISITSTFLIAILGFWLYGKMSNPSVEKEEKIEILEALPRVWVTDPKETTIPIEIPIDGRLMPFKQVTFLAKIGGELLPSKRKMQPGLEVQQGELLFQIDDRKAQQNLNALRSDFLNRILLFMPDLKLDNQRQYEKWEMYLAQLDLENTLPTLPKIEDEKEKFYLAAKGVFQLYYTIKSAEIQLEEYLIRAPFSGVFTAVNVEFGATVIPGQALATLIHKNHFELHAAVSEAELEQFAKGAKVVLKNANNQKKWIGEVSRIGGQIDPVTQNIPIYVSVKGNGLKAGIYLSGILKGKQLEDIIVLPKNSLIEHHFILTVRDSIIKKQAIEVLLEKGKNVFIKNTSIQDAVVIQSEKKLIEGERVAPIFEK